MDPGTPLTPPATFARSKADRVSCNERNFRLPHMPDGPPGADHRKPLLERLAALLLRVPEDREQLLGLLRQAHERALLDADAMSMIEGVLQVSELTARDIMVPRAEMDVLDISQPAASFLPKVVRTGHSRFPVVEGDRDNVVGILDAKALLRLYAQAPGSVRELLRPALFVPESKRLNLLLHDLRAERAHLAIVVDEYGGTAGLVTLEDVIEQIVGCIDDELDGEAEEADIVRIEPAPNGALRHRVRAGAKIELFNEVIGTQLPTALETIGSLVSDRLGHPPRRGERIEIDGIRFEVLRVGATHALLLRAENAPPEATRAAAQNPPPRPVEPPASGETGIDADAAAKTGDSRLQRAGFRAQDSVAHGG